MPPKKIKPGQETKQQIASFLPQAIEKSLCSYHLFMEQDVPDDAKGFSAHHSAAKVAIAHIELLLKLAHWAKLPDENTSDARNSGELAAMIVQARAELHAYKHRQELWEQEGENDE